MSPPMHLQGRIVVCQQQGSQCARHQNHSHVAGVMPAETSTLSYFSILNLSQTQTLSVRGSSQLEGGDYWRCMRAQSTPTSCWSSHTFKQTGTVGLIKTMTITVKCFFACRLPQDQVSPWTVQLGGAGCGGV